MEEGSRTQANEDGVRARMVWIGRLLAPHYLQMEYTPLMKTWLCCGAKKRNWVLMESQQSTLTF